MTGTVYGRMDVKWRDDSGRFSAAIEFAGIEMLQALGDKGKEKAEDYAPRRKGLYEHRDGDDPRNAYRALHECMWSRGRLGFVEWGCTARHAIYLEKGTHTESKIDGSKVSFYWEEQGRKWKRGPTTIIRDPIEAQPYLKPSLEDVMDEWQEVAKEYYPGNKFTVGFSSGIRF